MEYDPKANVHTSRGPAARAKEDEQELQNLRKEVKRLRARVRELEAQLADQQ
ncbi:hypothetical protein [Arthrobacter sp. ISL-95]|uniref:hypothetical protein n=1 Tax=Arthrobacter sp. ISL-95 TaxID=2819116 RepID=UPI001BE8F503|nr:hypothetical protein [Arthrobacter sp. ISL-95]MBT2587962.1 hypothetical protein [Arthrobacter sp. ISL-95]